MNKGISNFKNVFDLYGQIGILEVCLDIKKIGLYIYTTTDNNSTHDNSIHTMATFSNTSFLEYKCEKECTFTLSIKNMKENLKNITSEDVIELTIKKEHELKIKVTKKTIEFEKKNYMKEAQHYNIPIVLDQVQPLNIKCEDFLVFCRSISGKYVLTIKTEENIPEIIFKSEKNTTTIKGSNESGDIILPFEGEFKAEYFSKLKKFTKFNNTLKIYTNPNQPLIFETNIGSKDKDKVIIWIKSLKQMEDDYDEEDQEN